MVCEGTPVADTLIKAVYSAGADAIVMSTHGRSGLGRLVFGSVAEQVLRQSRIPVLLVRVSEEERKKNLQKRREAAS
jgi:nucleotide-binding universal stress UspA family protein